MRCLFFLLMLLTAASAPAREWRLCVDVNPWAGYTHPGDDGSLQKLVRAAASRQGDEVKYVALPWLRCEAMVESGALDGLVGVAGNAAARERFAFPLSGGLVDQTRSLAAVEIVLIRRSDSPVTWDGKKLRGLRDKVAYVQGYDAVGAKLDELKIPHSGEYHSDAQNMKAMMAGRTNVIATYAESAKDLLEDPDYKGMVSRLDPPLGRVFYYLAFNRTLYPAERDRMEGIWRSLAEPRKGD